MNVIRTLASLLLLCCTGGAFAQYAAQGGPIKLVVPYAAGGGSDTTARILAELLEPALGRQIIVENRAGGGAVVGTASVAKAKPDGTTLLLVGGGAVTAAPFLFKELRYDPLKDLQPIYFSVSSPLVLYVAADTPVRSFPELVTRIKAAPPKSASFGAHTFPNMVAMELVKESQDIDMTYVPYKSSGQILTDVSTKILAAAFADVSAATAFVNLGKVRPLAVMKRDRSALAPDLPTVYEHGYKGAEVLNWNGFFAPAGTPKGIVDQVAKALRDIAAKPENRERFLKVGLELNEGSGPESFARYLQEETKLFEGMIKRLGINPQ